MIKEVSDKVMGLVLDGFHREGLNDEESLDAMCMFLDDLNLELEHLIALHWESIDG